MELQTANQVSQEYGISTRMLRYYEQMGLMESGRKEDYAYRVYDEAAIKRLRQIIILRKLQIPIKQIKSILNNQDAVAVIEIFKQNISELDEKIMALSAVKSILARFVDDLQIKADIHLKLDLLSDNILLAVADLLSVPKSRTKEKVSMDELNKANEQLNKLSDREVRVVYLPPVTVACAYDPEDNPDLRDEPHRGATKSILQKFIKDTELFKIKPDARIFGWGDTKGGKRVYIMLATIPDGLDVSAPLTKINFPGGLYAMHPNDPLLIDEWTENSDRYEGGTHGPGMEEIINPMNLFGIKNIDCEVTEPVYINYLHPVKEIKILTEEEKNRLVTVLENLEETTSHKKTTEVDLAAMIKRGETELKYADGFMIIKAEGWQTGKGMETPQPFKLPLKIEMRAKTDGADVTLKYAKGIAEFNCKIFGTKLLICDIADGMLDGYKKRGIIPIDKFVDIEWNIGKKIMAVKVNGELRHISDDERYMQVLIKNPETIFSSPVTVAASGSSTVTVEKLCITEL